MVSSWIHKNNVSLTNKDGIVDGKNTIQDRTMRESLKDLGVVS